MKPLAEPYRARPIRFADVWSIEDWRLKVYGIAYDRPTPRPELFETAKALARATLPMPGRTHDRYGVGFVGVHEGRGATFLFVDWWGNENELHHVNFVAPNGITEVERFERTPDAVLCVWDLRVLEHERDAWLRHVLGNPEGPDLEAWLADRLDGEF